MVTGPEAVSLHSIHALVLPFETCSDPNVMPWDFALILLFFATAVPILGRRRIQQLLRQPETTKGERLSLYASTVVFQWIVAGLILWRARARGLTNANLAIALPDPALVCIVAVAISALLLINQLVSLRRLPQLPLDARGIMPQLAAKLFPQDGIERVAFLGVVTTVSVCEELIYRGFAQKVLQDWLGGFTAAGILVSAILFAIAHAYQGRRGCVTTFIVALAFASVRSWTGSLLAPCAAHFTADLTAGLLAPSRMQELSKQNRVSASHCG